MILDYWAFQEQRVLETNNLHHELTSIRFFPILKSILFHWAALHKMISYKTFISPVFGHQGNPWWEPQCRSPWCWGTVAGWGHLLDVETMFEGWKYLSCSEVKIHFGKLSGPWLLVGWQATHTVWSLRVNVGALTVWLLLTFDTPTIIFCWESSNFYFFFLKYLFRLGQMSLRQWRAMPFCSLMKKQN